MQATPSNRVFIFGAGFSKPAGMPLATELLPLLIERHQLDEMREWLDGMRERLAWLSGQDTNHSSLKLNIEQVFHYAHFDSEVHRLRQHLEPVGRGDGPGTPWNQATSIDAWLAHLERDLCDVILESESKSDLSQIKRWAQSTTADDAVLTFNYDTLVERALVETGKQFNHGMGHDSNSGIPVFKLHGSIDWIVADRRGSFSRLDLLFAKENLNRLDGQTGHIEDDYGLWRCRTGDQLHNWIKGRDLQLIPEGGSPRTVGVAGLGAYKELHRIPGLGQVWADGMRALYQAHVAIVVGFSMSDFDAMAQMQFAEVARARAREGRPLGVVVVDPFVDQAGKERFQRVFRSVSFIAKHHEDVDWLSVLQGDNRGHSKWCGA